jgi:hypothetical protein
MGEVMSTQHTPGPWPVRVYDQDESGTPWRYVSFDGGPKLLTDPIRGWPENHPDREIAVADARLIAAAPNIYRELAHLVRRLEPLEQGGGLNVAGIATLNGARAALAAVTRDQPQESPNIGGVR